MLIKINPGCHGKHQSPTHTLGHCLYPPYSPPSTTFHPLLILIMDPPPFPDPLPVSVFPPSSRSPTSSAAQLSFRSAQSLQSSIKAQVREVLQIPASAQSTPPPTAQAVSNVSTETSGVAEVEEAVSEYLRRNADSFNMSRNVEEVCSQIWATLYDYPCLKSCDGLVQYVKSAVRLAWNLINQSPPYVLEYEHRSFRKDMHIRFHSSDQNSDRIRCYLWPALLEGGANGPCVHKAVVIT